MVTVDCYPQLGNSLFQLAAAESLAKENDDIANVTNFKAAELFNYCPEDKVDNSSYLFKESSFHYTKPDYMPNLKLEGYFQSEKYFKQEEGYIREILEIAPEYKFEKKDYCAIHVRRGDYLKQPQYHPVLPYSYYSLAVEKIEKETGCDRYIVFSDDPKWCKEIFTESKFQVRDRMYDKGHWFDFSEQTSCRFHIIANSTFSWWSAWLSKSEYVVAPDPFKRWFGPLYSHYNMKDLIPKKWTIL